MSLVAFALLTQSQFSVAPHAPPDVPRNHWAYQAVDDMFAAGILDGYPSIPVTFSNSPSNEPWAVDSIRRLYREGLLPGFRTQVNGAPIRIGPYEEAIGAFTGSVYALSLTTKEANLLSKARKEAGTFTALLHLRAEEILQLGGDPIAQVRKLESKFRLSPPVFGG